MTLGGSRFFFLVISMKYSNIPETSILYYNRFPPGVLMDVITPSSHQQCNELVDN